MSSAISFLELLILLLVLAMIVGGIACIIIGVILRKKTNPDGGACGKCGYSVNQLETMTCPECGADLREVGIKTATGKGSAIALIAVGALMLLLCLGCVGFMSFALFRASTPSQTFGPPTVQPTPVSPRHPSPMQPSPGPPSVPQPTPTPTPPPGPNTSP